MSSHWYITLSNTDASNTTFYLRKYNNMQILMAASDLNISNQTLRRISCNIMLVFVSNQFWNILASNASIFWEKMCFWTTTQQQVYSIKDYGWMGFWNVLTMWKFCLINPCWNTIIFFHLGLLSASCLYCHAATLAQYLSRYLAIGVWPQLQLHNCTGSTGQRGYGKWF